MTVASVLRAPDGLLHFLDAVPEKYKSGPWHPFAVLILLGVALFLLLSAESAEHSYANDVLTRLQLQPEASPTLQGLRAGGVVYMVAVVWAVLRVAGAWPLASYTVTSWNLLAARLLFAALSSATGHPLVAVAAQALRFPALVGACITVSVWWLVLVPLIYFLLRKEPKRQRGFLLFNFSPMLLSLHLANLPIALADFAQAHTPLCFFDLWAGLAVCFCYILFYLNVLDRAGLHFYIVFTPRTPWVLLTYPAVLGLYVAVFAGANAWLAAGAARPAGGGR